MAPALKTLPNPHILLPEIHLNVCKEVFHGNRITRTFYRKVEICKGFKQYLLLACLQFVMKGFPSSLL